MSMSIFPRRIPFLTRSMQEMWHEMERFERGFFAPYWRSAEDTVNVGKTVGEVVNDPSKFAVSIDVSQFKPEELKVNLSGRTLSIEGSQEVKGDDGCMTRSFTRQWVLPEDVNLNEIQSSLTENGHLQIKALKQGAAAPKSIPIQPANESAQDKK